MTKHYQYFVKSILPLPGKVLEITMSPENKKMDYLPGQFIFVSFTDKELGTETHPFSVASSPSQEDLKILVKEAGDYTSKLKNLKPGTSATIEGPFGNLVYSKVRNKNQIWIAGGIGIAPFMGMFRDLAEDSKGYNVDLYYCSASQGEMVYFNELSKLVVAKTGAFNFIPFCQDQKGFISAGAIMELSGRLAGKDIFLCGPPIMITNLKKQFSKLGIRKSRIHSEEFQLLRS